MLERRAGEVYVHYVNSDKRLDEWVSEAIVRPAGQHEATMSSKGTSRKRKRVPTDGSLDEAGRRSPTHLDAGSMGPWEFGLPKGITEEEYDIQHHKQITAKRNFDKVNFGRWQIKTWYVCSSAFDFCSLLRHLITFRMLIQPLGTSLRTLSLSPKRKSKPLRLHHMDHRPQQLGFLESVAQASARMAVRQIC